MKFRSLLPKRFRGNLTNQQKVQRAKSQIENSLSMFSKIHNDLEGANETLSLVIVADTQLIEETQVNINSAQKEFESNKALQEKIKAFIKE